MMTSRLSIDPKKTIAVLIGASKFPDDEKLADLPSVKNNIKDLEEVLCDENIIGLPKENIHRILNKPTRQEVLLGLGEACAHDHDALIFYYAGHGLLGPDSNELYVATKSTTNKDINATAIRFEDIRAYIKKSGAKKKIVIVDSCFSGRMLERSGAMSDAAAGAIQSGLEFDLKGTFAMASAPANRAALAPPGERNTAFTGTLLETLKSGVDSSQELISVRALFDSVKRKLRGKSGVPEPKSVNVNDAHKIYVAVNTGFRSRGASKRLIQGVTLRGIEEALYSCHKLLKDAEKAGGNIWFVGFTFAFGPAHKIQRVNTRWNKQFPDRTLEDMSDEFNSYLACLIAGTLNYPSSVHLVCLKPELLKAKFLDKLYKRQEYAYYARRYPAHIDMIENDIDNFQNKVVGIANVAGHPVSYVDDIPHQVIVTEFCRGDERITACTLLEVGTGNVGQGKAKGVYSEIPDECRKMKEYVLGLEQSAKH